MIAVGEKRAPRTVLFRLVGDLFNLKEEENHNLFLKISPLTITHLLIFQHQSFWTSTYF